jgi:hypothetical protein
MFVLIGEPAIGTGAYSVHVRHGFDYPERQRELLFSTSIKALKWDAAVDCAGPSCHY